MSPACPFREIGAIERGSRQKRISSSPGNSTEGSYGVGRANCVIGPLAAVQSRRYHGRVRAPGFPVFEGGVQVWIVLVALQLETNVFENWVIREHPYQLNN